MKSHLLLCVLALACLPLTCHAAGPRTLFPAPRAELFPPAAPHNEKLSTSEKPVISHVETPAAEEPAIDRDTPPLVIGAWMDSDTKRVIIANYAEARRIAVAEGRPLVVLSRLPHAERDRLSQQEPENAVLTVAEDDERFPARGVYRYQPRAEKGRTLLMQTAAPRELLFFTAEWCAVCKKMLPLAQAAGARIVDIDKEPALAKQHKADGRVPVLVALEGTREVGRIVGVATAQQIEALRTK